MKNDNKILELKQKIEIKREELKNSKITISYKTNCMFNTDGILNLRVLDYSSLLYLFLKLKAMCKVEHPYGELVIHGFPIQDWIEDIESLLKNLKWQQDKKQLDIMENKLNSMLSKEKKDEIELDNIENLLR